MDRHHRQNPNRDSARPSERWRSNNPRKYVPKKPKEIQHPPMSILRRTDAPFTSLNNPFEQKNSLFRHKPRYVLYNNWNNQTNADRIFRQVHEVSTIRGKDDEQNRPGNIWSQLMYLDIIQVQSDKS